MLLDHFMDLCVGPSLDLLDLLHEGGNAGDVPVGEAAKAVETALRTAHPDAIWAILGWQTNPSTDLLKAVDSSRMLIVDGLSDRYTTVTDRESDWGATPYAFGSIWNFGGHTPVVNHGPYEYSVTGAPNDFIMQTDPAEVHTQE